MATIEWTLYDNSLNGPNVKIRSLQDRIGTVGCKEKFPFELYKDVEVMV
jgi:hypothetical protein